MNRGLIRSDSADLSKTIFLQPKQRLLFALMPDDVFASIWEMFNFIVWSDHIWRSRRHEGKKQLNILPGMRIFLPTTAIFCCDHWVQDDPDLLTKPRIHLRSKVPTEPKDGLQDRTSPSVSISPRRLIEPLALAYIWGAHGACGAVHINTNQLLDLSSISLHLALNMQRLIEASHTSPCPTVRLQQLSNVLFQFCEVLTCWQILAAQLLTEDKIQIITFLLIELSVASGTIQGKIYY